MGFHGTSESKQGRDYEYAENHCRYASCSGIRHHSIPSQSLAQGGQAGGQVPQPVGGIATVIGVDQPDNCLRIRSGPENSYDVVGCANMGEQLKITGVWTSNDWAQLADNSWVYGPQIQTDLRPPRTAYSRSPSYVVTEEVAPDYYDWGYLPYYGYDTLLVFRNTDILL